MKNTNYNSYLQRLVVEGKFETKDELVKHILLKVLGFDSTEEQKSDRLDFKEVSILKIKDVLDAVYIAGQMSTK